MSFVIAEESHQDPAAARQLIEWVSTRTWEESREFLDSHVDGLLGESAEAALQQLIADNPSHQVLELHLELLRTARARSIADAYQALEESVRRHAVAERIVAWVGTQSWEDARAFFDQQASVFMTDEAESVIAALAADNPDQPDLLAHRGLLALCRVDGPDKAYDLLEDPERLHRLVTSSAAQDDEARALPRARLLAGLYPDTADAQFNLAVASIRAGVRDEAEAAVARCAQLSSPKERRAYGRRLTEIGEGEPDLFGGLALLRSLLGVG